jgi:hypothetical protein
VWHLRRRDTYKYADETRRGPAGQLPVIGRVDSRLRTVPAYNTETAEQIAQSLAQSAPDSTASWLIRPIPDTRPGEPVHLFGRIRPRPDRAASSIDLILHKLTQGPAVMIGRPPPPAAPMSDRRSDRPCHSDMAGQTTSLQMWSGQPELSPRET